MASWIPYSLLPYPWEALTNGAEVTFQPRKDQGAILPYLQIFSLGANFGIEEMCDYALNSLGNYLSPVLAQLCDPSLQKKTDDDSPTRIQQRVRGRRGQGFIDAFLQALEAADEIRMADQGLQEQSEPYLMLVEFFVACKEVLLIEAKVEAFLTAEAIPGFPLAVLLSEIHGPRTKWMRQLVTDPPAKLVGKTGLCWACGVGLKSKDGGGVGLVNPKSKVVHYTQACCMKCSDSDVNIIISKSGKPVTKWSVFDSKK